MVVIGIWLRPRRHRVSDLRPAAQFPKWWVKRGFRCWTIKILSALRVARYSLGWLETTGLLPLHLPPSAIQNFSFSCMYHNMRKASRHPRRGRDRGVQPWLRKAGKYSGGGSHRQGAFNSDGAEQSRNILPKEEQLGLSFKRMSSTEEK